MAADAGKISYVICSATEDYVHGAETSATVGDDAYIIAAGGSTSDTWQAFGLNSWTFVGEFIDNNGVTATNGGLANKTSGSAYEILAANVSTDLVWADGESDAVTIVNGPTATNHCWTAVAARPDAIATKRAVIGGFSGSINTCLKHAVDGYSFWGASILAKVGEDWAGSELTDNNAALVLSELGA